MEEVDVVVVGGGLSGLAAAETLAANGKRVLLLEADSKRLGGRVWTDRRGSSVLEKGASFFGPTQPHVLALIRRFGLQDFIEGHGIAAESCGVNHLGGGGHVALDLCFRADVQTHDDGDNARRAIRDMEELTRRIAHVDTDDPSCWTEEWKGLDAISLAGWIEANILESPDYKGCDVRYIGEMIRMFAGTVLSVEAEEISAFYFFWYLARCGGFRAMTRGVADGPDSKRLPGGYDDLVERLARALRAAGVTIEHGATVTKVAEREGKYDVHAKGRVYAAAHVVVAVPPHVARAIEFEGVDLGPRALLHEAMRPGRTLKGYLVYETAWWKKRFADTSTIEGLPALRQRLGAAQNEEEVAAAQLPVECRPALYPGGYSGYTNGKREPVIWTMPMTWGDAKENPALLWFVVGKTFDEWMHEGGLDRDRRKKAVEEAVKKLHRHADVPPCAECIETPWEQTASGGVGGPAGVLPANVFSRCAASLRAPCGNVHWASTETARAWGGYMDGALEAGVRAAREVLGLPPHAITPPSFEGDPSSGPTTEPMWWEPVAPPSDEGPGKPGTGRAGFAAVPLDVSDGLEMAGYGPRSKRGRFDHGRERLFARALYLEDASSRTRVALCAVDLLCPSTSLVAKAAARLVEDGLGPDEIVVTGTHTHLAPGRYFGAPFYDAFAQRLELRPGARHDELLADELAEAIARAIRVAKATARPAKVGFGEGVVWRAGANRSRGAFEKNPEAPSWRERDWLGGPAPTDLADVLASKDPRVRAIAAFEADGGEEAGLIGAFASFGCHGTALGVAPRTYERDWPGRAADLLDAAYAKHDPEKELWTRRRVAVAISGGGDVSPLPPRALEPNLPVAEIEKLQGRQCMKTVAENVAGGIRVAIEAARRDAAPIELGVERGAFRPPAPDAWAVGWPLFSGAEDARQFGYGLPRCAEGRPRRRHDPADPQSPKRVVRIGARLLRRRFPLSSYHPIHRIRIGARSIVTVPGEPTAAFVVRLEDALKKPLHADAVWVLGYAGDYAGYFTTPEEYEQQHYEGASTLYGRATYEALAAAYLGAALPPPEPSPVRVDEADSLDELLAAGPVVTSVDEDELEVALSTSSDPRLMELREKADEDRLALEAQLVPEGAAPAEERWETLLDLGDGVVAGLLGFERDVAGAVLHVRPAGDAAFSPVELAVRSVVGDPAFLGPA